LPSLHAAFRDAALSASSLLPSLFAYSFDCCTLSMTSPSPVPESGVVA